MVTKLCAGLIVAFWLVMMTLLVRHEFFPDRIEAMPVPPQVVMRRVFTADDFSTLKVFYNGKESGTARFQVEPIIHPRETPRAAEGLESSRRDDEMAVDGRRVLERTSAYQRSAYKMAADLYLKLDLVEAASRIHVSSILLFDDRYQMTWLQFRLSRDDKSVAVERDMSSSIITLRVKEGHSQQVQVLDLNRLKGMKFGGEMDFLGLGGDRLLGMAAQPNATSAEPAGPQWVTTTSRTSLRVSKQLVPVYLVTTRLNEALWVKVWISSQGQILKLDSSLKLTMTAEGLEVDGLHDRF